METKILKAVFGGGTSTVTNKRTRTDYGQVLEIIGIDLPDTFECIFSNSNTSAGVGKKMIGSSQRVLIPDEYLATGQTIYAWVLVHDSEDDGRHMYSIRIPVADMPDTSPEEPTPVEQSVISQAIAALNSAVTTTSQKASEATASADRAEHAAEGVEGYAERAESAQQAAESARDRATQAETSARTSAATASEKASEAISSATTASQSAIDAEQESERAKSFAESSAQAAEASRQFSINAGNSAYDASESVQEASGYASNANTSAQTASQKALEAAQSAQTATQAKTDADTAKQESETAQRLAETARNEAVSAKTGAESARDEAQDIVDGITGKVEQIDSNTERIGSLENDRYRPYPTDTASGSIASFPDGADNIPLKSCIVQIEPVQDLHGYDSPWPAGGGKNLVNVQDATGITSQTEITGWFTLPAGTYTMSAYISNSGSAGVGVRYSSRDATVVKTAGYATTSTTERKSATFTLENETEGRISVIDNAAGYNGTVSKVQIESGSTATDYAPYSNECPITGWTGCEIKHSGADTSNPTAYPIAFPTEAGTIYGGYVDVTGGELVVDRAIVDLGTLNWLYTSGATYPRFSAMVEGAKGYDGGATAKGVCSVYPIVSQNDGYHGAKTKCIAIVGGGYVWAWDSAYTDAESFKNAMNGVQLVYELAEPIHYPLTPTEIRSLLGQNNVWADCGDTEVTYRADTTLYINKKIAEAVSALS